MIKHAPAGPSAPPMMIADSIGFAATHAIADRLAATAGTRVTHGSRNFDRAGAIGEHDQSPEAFVGAMRAAARSGLRPYAVHAVFDPVTMAPLCAGRGIAYKVIVREPRAQVRSCQAWVLRRLLDGDASAFAQVRLHDEGMVRRIGLPRTLSNAAYAFAASHVLGYALRALAVEAPLVRMEEVMADDAAFRAAFDLPADAAPPAAAPAGAEGANPSHRARAAALEAAPADEAVILRALEMTCAGEALDWAGLCARLGYPEAGGGADIE